MATRRTRSVRPSLPRTAFAAGAAAVLVLLSGCSSSDRGDSGDASGGAVEPALSDAGGGDVAREQSGGGAGDDGAAAVAGQGVDSVTEPQRVISTGNVQLRADDVDQAIFDVRKVVDTYGGQIAEDDTQTDKDGDALRSRMVLRIPTADFDEAMGELGRVATLISSKRETADVTNQVLDTDVRVEAQRRSIDRIQVLFDNATSIKDIVAIEAELSRRQADLASLEAQQRYLADQTAQSTITLSVERTPEKGEPRKDDTDEAGFLAGLEGGWSALKTFLLALATVGGALLPWVALGLVLAVPAWPLVRRLRRREAPAPTL